MGGCNTLNIVEGQAIHEFPSDESGGWECQRILHDWFGRLRERAGKDTTQYRRDVWDAVSVLRDIHLALCPGERTAQRAPLRLWAWPTEEAITDPPRSWLGRSPLIVDHLDDALAKYLKRPWLQHDAIDISAINALLFTELAEFSEQVRSGAVTGTPNWSYIFGGGNIFAQLGLAVAGRIVSFLAAWVVLPAVALGLLVYGYETGAMIAIGLWVLYVLYYLITIPARWQMRKARRDGAAKANEIIRAMLNAWGAARGSTINPSRLKELVLVAEERGAVFQPVLHTLIDRAIQRDPTALARD